mmetsp:Transcript_24504/g.36713  ORF Transcript_24504/g.36713 Transcript_24504/m.36713 type:complete len:195 (-) Transcript_24504:60-644(-)
MFVVHFKLTNTLYPAIHAHRLFSKYVIVTFHLQPKSRREYMIIKMAAEKATITPQFEIMLKVKQQGNQDFGFLDQGNELNPFYCYLKGENTAANQPDDLSSSSTDSPANFAGLVDYSSSSEEEGFAEKKVNNNTVDGESNDEEDVVAKQAASITENGDPAILLHEEEMEERRAKRLKQARMLNDHFARKIKEDS